jgi:heme/copper-type cytochrome/quinol oxidase subunit 1
MTRRAGLTSRLVLAVGSVLSVVGVVVLAVASARPVSFGWFAYAPLSDTTFTADGVHLFSTASLVGAVVLVIGLLVLAAWLGYRQGARRRP